MSFGMIWCAFVLDLIVGDPQWAPHPVRGIGYIVDKMEAWVRSWARSERKLRWGGVILSLSIVLAVLVITTIILAICFAAAEWFGILASVVLAYTTIAVRDLYLQSWSVVKALKADDLTGARERLSMIVGRDTAELDADAVLRAVIETVAENLSDGVIAPLFYLALGGVPLAMAYKAASTLDSMLGYKNERYLHLGWFSARMDDVLNYVPARLTALLIAGAAYVLRLDPVSAWKIFRRDGDKHKSPNAGRPEAAMAGALGVRLGGPSYYQGLLSDKPYIGDAVHPLDTDRVQEAEHVLFVASVLMVILASTYRMI